MLNNYNNSIYKIDYLHSDINIMHSNRFLEG